MLCKHNYNNDKAYSTYHPVYHVITVEGLNSMIMLSVQLRIILILLMQLPLRVQ